jgi:beta propeller repeat protein
MYDLATATETPICTNSAAQYYPDIWGDRIVWQDERAGNWDIYMYELATGTESVVCGATGNQTLPAIDGDRVVWQDDRNGSSDIYMNSLAICSFDDVLRYVHPFWQQIEALYAHAVTSGTSTAPPLYGPTGSVTRGQMAAFLCRAFDYPPTDDWSWYDPGAATFTDVPRGTDGIYSNPETDGMHPFYGCVERLCLRGVTSGIGGGLYGTTGSVTRGQMAVFICKAAGKTWYNKPTATFADVARGDDGEYSTPPYSGGYDADGTFIFYGWIERLADAASWSEQYGPPTQGTSPTTFPPTGTSVRGQMAAFIQRAREFELPVK